MEQYAGKGQLDSYHATFSPYIQTGAFDVGLNTGLNREHVSDADELALALKRGEERALAELYDRYGGSVYHLALRITHDPGAAEEISLDAFLQIWRQAARYDTHHGTLASWLFTIARSRAIDRLRAAGATKRTHAEDPGSVNAVEQPEDVAAVAERRALVRQAMDSLPAAQRVALELAYYEGLSHSQIAARLGEPLGTVKTRIRNAMQVLRKALAPVLSTSV
jgi:RNA polymerase sigma-70 factor, ECF subfamily